MNLAHRLFRFAAAVLLMAAAAGEAAPVAQTIPFFNSFETYTNGRPVQALTNDGWDASDPSVIVETNVVWNGTRSVVVPMGMAVSNAMATVAMTNVWTEGYLRMEPDNQAGAGSINNNAVLEAKLDASSGYLQAYYVGTGWVTLSNTVWGAGVQAVTNGQWVRVSVCQNYVAHQCAVFLNGALVTELLPFINTNVNACASFRVGGGSWESSYLDDFSIGWTYPATLTNDWNGDGVTDAWEIATYGYLALTLNVGPGQTYTTIQSAVTAALPRYTINVASGTYTENVYLAQSLAGLTGTAFAVNGSLGIGPGAVVNVRGLTSCGNLGVSNAASLYLAGALSASNVTIGAGGVLTGTAFTVNGSLSLGTGAVVRVSSLTCSGDLTVSNVASLTVAGAASANNVTLGSGAVVSVGGTLNANSLTLASGASLTAAGGLSVTGSVSVNSSASLVVNGQLIGQTVNVSGALALSSGSTLTCTNLIVGNNVALNLTHVTVTAGALTIGAGATVVVVNGTVTANGMTLTGSFTLDQNWGNQSASSQLPYSDNFEIYSVGTPMNALGFRGWGATDNSVMIETNHACSGSNGVVVGYGMALSNRVNSAGASQVWTDFRGILSFNANDIASDFNSNAAFSMVVMSNGYLGVYDRTNGAWDVCTHDVWGNSVASVGTGEWVRISVLTDYAAKQCAVFLRGALVRQRLPFINTNRASYSVVTLDNDEATPAYGDDVYIGAAYPASLTNDVNNNGVPDAQEIALMGTVFSRGSVFLFR